MDQMKRTCEHSAMSMNKLTGWKWAEEWSEILMKERNVWKMTNRFGRRTALCTLGERKSRARSCMGTMEGECRGVRSKREKC